MAVDYFSLDDVANVDAVVAELDNLQVLLEMLVGMAPREIVLATVMPNLIRIRNDLQRIDLGAEVA